MTGLLLPDDISTAIGSTREDRETYPSRRHSRAPQHAIEDEKIGIMTDAQIANEARLAALAES